MKARELREFSSEELQHKQQELIEELFNLRFSIGDRSD
jgi:ribosomal protein L29